MLVVVGHRDDAILVAAFLWDYQPGRNVEHIARHGVGPEDVEEVLSRTPHFFRNTTPYGASHVMVGPNDAGRYLRVALTETSTEGVWYVVTAHWLSKRRGERLYESQ